MVRVEFEVETPENAAELCRAAADWDSWYTRQENLHSKMACGHLGSASVRIKEDNVCGLCYIDAAEHARRALGPKLAGLGVGGKRIMRAWNDARQGLLYQG